MALPHGSTETLQPCLQVKVTLGQTAQISEQKKCFYLENKVRGSHISLEKDGKTSRK